LTPANVAQRIGIARPDAVDVRTGVERDGRKDPSLVRTFVAVALGALG
jgi:phosphoribosylanthranilate isomerase